MALWAPDRRFMNALSTLLFGERSWGELPTSNWSSLKNPAGETRSRLRSPTVSTIDDRNAA